ncbi:MAG: DUF6263 family protein [Planctomycetaceae bacterium]|nr:DUF6263 family protein [Planctomycetaceae bacterium]
MTYQERFNRNASKGTKMNKTLLAVSAGHSFALFAAFCFTCLFGTPHFAAAQEVQSPLRWKLKPGEAFAVELVQHTASKVAFSGKSADTTIDLGLTLLWTVESVTGDQLKVKQTVQRITFSLEPQKGDAIKYDSASRMRPVGQARQVADAVQPLLGAEIELTMTSRGQIVSTAPANAAAEKLFAKESSEQAPNVFSREALQTLLSQWLVVLPEKAVAADETWTDEPREIKSAAGKFTQATIYRHAGQVEESGQKLDKIEMTAKLTPVAGGAAAPKLTVKSHEQTGKILFSANDGRLVRAEQIQKLSTERPYRETTITVNLESKQTTTLKSAGE